MNIVNLDPKIEHEKEMLMPTEDLKNFKIEPQGIHSSNMSTS